MRAEIMKKSIKMFKESIPETTIAEVYLDTKHEIKLRSIGHVKDIDSNFKNDFFEEIFEDENGTIMDLRIYDEKPTVKELNEMVEYWRALTEKFEKPVQPCFIITGENPD